MEAFGLALFYVLDAHSFSCQAVLHSFILFKKGAEARMQRSTGRMFEQYFSVFLFLLKSFFRYSY